MRLEGGEVSQARAALGPVAAREEEEHHQEQVHLLVDREWDRCGV